MAAVSDIVAPEKQYIQYTNKGEVTVLAGCVIAVGENAVFKTVEKALTKANLDQGADFEHGKDYYIYICDPGTNSQDEVYLISLNSTFPDGETWDDTNTRKIGGFHYGRVRNTDEHGRAINTSGSVRGSGWESNTRVDILPNSVWTTKHRPKCDPSGMVYLGNALWGTFTFPVMTEPTAYSPCIIAHRLQEPRDLTGILPENVQDVWEKGCRITWNLQWQQTEAHRDLTIPMQMGGQRKPIRPERQWGKLQMLSVH